jgi:hypothetical protein
MMSEIFFGAPVFIVSGIAAAGSALAELFRQAGVPFKSSLLSHMSDFSAASLLDDWHQQLSQTLSFTRQTLSVKQSPFLEPLAQAKALNDALSKMPLLSHIIQHTQPTSLQQAQAALRQSEEARLKGDTDTLYRHALTAKRLLEDAVVNAYERLASAQQTVLSNAVTASLRELGYQVSQHQNERGVALWGVKGGTGVAVVVGKDGSLQMDMMGFDGLSCQAERNRILAKVAEKGITIQQKSAVLHGRKSGGQLLETAHRLARQRRLSVPQALLESAFPKRQQQGQDLRRRQILVWGQKVRL